MYRNLLLLDNIFECEACFLLTVHSFFSLLTNSNCFYIHICKIAVHFMSLHLQKLFFSNLPSSAGFAPRAIHPKTDRDSGADCPNAILVLLTPFPGVVDGHHAPDFLLLPRTSCCDNTI